VLDDRRATRQAIHALRAARSRRRLRELDWIDTVYKAYITVILSGAAIFYLAPVFGDTTASHSLVTTIRHQGPAGIGVVIAVVVTLGLRSGGRGGPLALEGADITHVLLAPVRRATVLRSSALRQLRGVFFMGAVAGAVLGTLASVRLPGSTLAWLGVGVATGILVALTAWGAALIASGLRLGVGRATAIGAVLIAWAVADLVVGTELSPTTQIGRVALGPLHWSPAAAIGVVLPVATLLAGFAFIGGSSLEAAERRAGLVGQLRFAATIQDLRTVMVLHRQLAQELPRSRPWWHVSARARGRAVWRRDWQGIARWPIARVARVTALSLVAGAALVGARQGAAALVIVAGIALFLAALDVSEGLAQELDHPERPASYPVAWGELIMRHLIVPGVVLLVVELPALGLLIGLTNPGPAASLAAIVWVPVAFAGTCGAATALTLSAPSAATQLAFGIGFGAPELATLALVLRVATPPAVMIAALTPLVLTGHPVPLEAAAAISLAVVTISVAAGAWLQSRRLRFE
jgi:hypothetical protein